MPLTALLDLRIQQDVLDTAHEAIKEILAGTRGFPGCLGVQVFSDMVDPSHLLVIETWASAEDDAAYRAWRAGEGASNLGGLLDGAPVLTRFTLEADI